VSDRLYFPKKEKIKAKFSVISVVSAFGEGNYWVNYQTLTA